MSITDCDQVYGPGTGHFNEEGIGGNPYPYGQCTWYVWQFYHDTQQVDIEGTMGNATEWSANAHREGWTLDQVPAVGKVVVWSSVKYPPYGHVAVILGLTDRGFRVGEMNFTYFASSDPSMVGKIDCREVTDLDGVEAFLTPHGVQIGGQDQGSNLLAALAPGMGGIASAISQAGLFIQAELMTAQLKATSMAQVGGGLAIAGAGGLLAAFTLAGHGDPISGARTLPDRFRREAMPAEPEPVVTEPNWTAAERAWMVQREAVETSPGLSPGARRTMAQQRSVRRGTPSQATQLRQQIRQARAARRAAGENSKAWVQATVRLRQAEARLRSLSR